MNLEAIRRILLMTTAEAAKVLAATEYSPSGVSETTWNRWESGAKTLPQDVYDRIDESLAKRAEYLLHSIDTLRQALQGNESISVHWPQNNEKQKDLDWYLMRSAHAELIALGADSELSDG